MVDQRRFDDQRWVGRAHRCEAPRDPGPVALRVREPRPGAQRARARAGGPGCTRSTISSGCATRRDARAGHGAVAAGALRWGEPVLDSGGHRDHAARSRVPRPARRSSSRPRAQRFENVAELLWSGYLPSAPVTVAAHRVAARAAREASSPRRRAAARRDALARSTSRRSRDHDARRSAAPTRSSRAAAS